MSARTTVVVVLLIGLIGAGGYGAYQMGLRQGLHETVPTAAEDMAKPAAPLVADQKTPLYWYDPMVPQQKFDKPGKSPFMDMQLVAMYGSAGTDEGTVTVSPRLEQSLGVRTARVTRGVLGPAVEAVGSIAYNERDVELVQARANGFVEKLYVRAPLDAVKKGQALAALYIPEWVAVQEEFLAAKRLAAHSGVDGLGSLLDGARQRMRLAGMPDDQITRLEATGRVQARALLTAPRAGVIGELSTREGMTVMTGAPLFRINGLTTVWVNAEVPESEAAWLAPGSLAVAHAAAFPDQQFRGKVEALLPEVDLVTRTLKARIELDNPGQRLVPGMFVTVSIAALNATPVLLVPTEAVIETGKRRVVIVAEGDGKFAPADVDVGAEANGHSEIRKGLKADQQVVISGQFLIDSEASLKATVSRMTEPSPASASLSHHGNGVVKKIGTDSITISHGPITSLKWGPMTMGFKLPAEDLPKDIVAGGHVSFEIQETTSGEYQITTITPDDPAHVTPMMDGMQDDAQGRQP